MRLLDWLRRPKRPFDAPMAALIDRNQAILDKAQAELDRHERIILAASYRQADQVLTAVHHGKVAVKR